MENSTPQVPVTPQEPVKKSNKVVVIVIVIVVILVVLGIVGSVISGFLAKKFAEKTTESIISSVTNGSVDVNTKNNTITINGENGTTTIGSQKLPDDFPKDIPVYSGANVLGSVTGDASQGTAMLVTFVTKDSFEQVKRFFDAELPRNGWAKELTTNYENSINYVVTKNGMRLTVVVAPNDEDQVSITISEEKE